VGVDQEVQRSKSALEVVGQGRVEIGGNPDKAGVDPERPVLDAGFEFRG